MTDGVQDVVESEELSHPTTLAEAACSWQELQKHGFETGQLVPVAPLPACEGRSCPE